MSFFDDLRKNIDAISKASEKVVRKSGGAVELRKLRMEQESLKNELNNCYAQIGRLVVEKMDGVDIPAEMEMLVQQIADCKEALAENEQLIARKKGLRICPVCGTKADKAAVFCQKCGTRLPDFSGEEEEESAPEAEEPAAEEASAEAEAEPAEEDAPEEESAAEEAPAPEEEPAAEESEAEPEDTPV